MDTGYIEITEVEAKKLYCEGKKVFITNDKREYWKLPESYLYGSHAPAEELFYRSVPMHEGDTRYYRL